MHTSNANSTVYAVERTIEHRVVHQQLMASAHRAVTRGRDLCLAVHERRRRSDFINHLAKYAKMLPRMRRCLPLAGGDGDPLHIKTEDRLEGTVAYVSGEVDIGNAARLKDAIWPVASDARNVILDVTALRYIDSSGLKVLMDVNERLRQYGCYLVVVGASPGVAKVMRILRLDESMPLVSSIDEATELIRAKSTPAAADG